MSSAFDERDTTAILSGLFHLQATLSEIADDVWTIRRILGGEDDEGEEEDPGEDDGGQGPLA
jgi:hypothetical protein